MRAEGYYWVKYKGEWIIGEWENNNPNVGSWQLTRSYESFQNSEFDEIDERRIERHEPIATITRWGNKGLTQEEIEDGCKQYIPIPPQKIENQ